MSARKPLSTNCNGSIDCPVDGHVSGRSGIRGRWQISHMNLTQGQRKTLRERREATRTHAAAAAAADTDSAAQQAAPEPHPAHTGHEYGGAYARAGALAAGDPDWMNATGGETSPEE